MINNITIAYRKHFDVIIIGGGHAGIEAAMASSRTGSFTLLLTHNMDTLGQMSCNPAIGGIGKGHLVKEIDAMGGVMAQVIDKSGIHFKILNSSKGPAVRATRAQADRMLYSKEIRRILNSQSNLMIIQQEVIDLVFKEHHVFSVITNIGVKFYATTVVLTAGTFLNGKIYIGTNYYSGGRTGDPASITLAQRFKELPFKIGRLKTGTPPRIDVRSINFNNLTPQYSDNPLPVFSFVGTIDQHPKQIPCYITYTNCRTHEIISQNLNRNPIYSNIIESIGPRYCPSIEDKVVRFSHKDTHQIFLEPEGLCSNEIYPNGISTSMPFDIQIKFIHTIKGLEKACIIRPGYAIEYDFFDPKDLKLTMESKLIQGLFFAGQINGTTGYEEAAAQGMLAGLNASLLSQGKEGWIPRRSEAYLGVLIDDLCTLGTKEPYRMFTSRAEYRLLLREDNADLRLTEIAYKLGMVDNRRWALFCSKRENIEKELQRLRNTWMYPGQYIIDNDEKLSITHEITAEDLLRRPNINYLKLSKIKEFVSPVMDDQITQQVENQIKYQGYILRQQEEIKYLLRHEHTLLPSNIDYNDISGLSNEVILKLNKYKPNSIAQATRINGITPVAISILLIWLKKHNNVI